MSDKSLFYVEVIRRVFKWRKTLAKATRVPGLGRAAEKMFFDEDAIFILPRDEVLRKTKSVSVDLGREVDFADIVLPSEVVRHFVNRSTHRFIMNTCICRETNDCKNHPHDLGCMFLGKGTLKIDPRLGRMVSKEEALEHVRRCSDAGLVHLIGRNKIDSLWLDTGPKEDLLTICNCCSCCCLWRMLPDLSPKIARRISKLPGVVVEVNAQACTGCGICAEEGLCFVGAISMRSGVATIDQEMCRGCSRCVSNCPAHAIELKIVQPAAATLAIEKLEGLVDVTSQ